MPTDLPSVERALITAFLKYLDWDGSDEAPYPLVIPTKREADPRRLVALADGFPAAAVQRYQLQPAERPGQQQILRFTVRVSLIHKFSVGEEPTSELRELTGKVVENVLQSKSIEGQWIGEDWVMNVYFPTILPADNELERYLRQLTSDGAGTGAGYTGGQVEFPVTAVIV